MTKSEQKLREMIKVGVTNESYRPWVLGAVTFMRKSIIAKSGLLEACKEALKVVGWADSSVTSIRPNAASEIHDKLRAAIAKAEGR